MTDETDTIPAPPGYLTSAGRYYWQRTLSEWDIEPHLLPILENACQLIDRIAQCRNRIRKDGLTILDKHAKPIAHPALAVERQAMKALLQCVSALKLKDEPEPPPARPGRNRGGRPPGDSDYTPARAR